MRLLHIISSLDPAAGGVSQAVLTIVKGLSALGIANEVATIDAPEAAYLKNKEFRIYGLGPGKTAWQYGPPLLQWLKEHLQEYDAVMVHGLWQYHTYAVRKALNAGKGKKPKLFIMPHGMLDPYFQQAKGRKIKALRNWLFWKLTEGKLVNSADALLFTCETEKLLAGEPFKPYAPKAEKVVGLGVDAPPLFDKKMTTAFREKAGVSFDNYWLFISRIHEKKGVDLLIKAYLQLKKEKGHLPPLIVAGPGLDTDFGKQMQQLAAADKNVIFPGMLSGDAKWGAFYGCEVYILPSHQENFGIAVVEALACGKPVIISDKVNIYREIIGCQAGLEGGNNEDDVLKLLKHWYELSGSEKLKLTANAGPAYKKFFTNEIFIKKMAALLNEYL